MGDQILAITIPPGYGPGQQLVVQAPDGQKLQIIIPPGMTGGQQLQVAVPKAPAAPPAAPSMPRVPPAPSPPAGLKQLKKKAKVAAPEVEMTGALASAATNAKNVAAGDNEKQMDSLMLKARQLNVARYEVQEALEQAGGHVGQAFKALQKISDDKAAQLAATVGDGMSGPKKILRNAQYSHDPLGDLLKGDIETLPPIYSDQAQYFRELEKKLRQPVWQVADTGASDNPILRQDIYLDADATHNKLLTIPIYPDEIVIPKIDILQTSRWARAPVEAATACACPHALVPTTPGPHALVPTTPGPHALVPTTPGLLVVICPHPPRPHESSSQRARVNGVHQSCGGAADQGPPQSAGRRCDM